MAEEDKRLSQTLDEMNRDVTLKLVPYGGRVFVNNADINRVDECSIELKCWFSPAAFSLNVTIGEEEHSRVTHYSDEDEGEQVSSQAEQDIGWQLGDVPIMLTLYRVDEKWLNESAEKNNGSPVMGRFHYYPRINTADGVVKDKRPTVTAWTCLGADNFALLRSRLIDFKKHDFEIGLSVVFPHGTVESQGFMGKRIKWNGEGELPVKSASIVWRKEDWSSDFHRKERMFDDKPKAELPFDPPREHIEVMDATRRIEAALGRLVTPIWLTVAALIVLAFLRR